MLNMDTYKQLIDSLGAELLELCKQKKDKDFLTEPAERLLAAGADVNYKGCRPIYFAVKFFNFPLIKLLIAYGALDNPVSRRYLAGMCERGSFDEKKEDAFFEIIDLAVQKTGFDIVYLDHFINMALVSGRVERLYAALDRYGLSMKDAFACVKQMIIFEVIELKKSESLALINRYLINDSYDWRAEGISAAVAIGQSAAVEYILKNRTSLLDVFADTEGDDEDNHAGNTDFKPATDLRPTKESIVRAIAAGHIDTLRVLDDNGINLVDEGYIKTACHCFAFRPAALQFFVERGLLENGRGYGGKSVYQNALEEENTSLLKFLKEKNINY